MSRKRSALKGDQLAMELPAEAHQLRVEYIPRDVIVPDPAQPREEPDAELRDSIAKHGILQPIVVRRHPTERDLWMIVDGERRWRGAEAVQEVIPCLVRGDQDEDPRRLLTQLVANTGKPLEPLEEAKAFKQLLHATGWTVVELAEQSGRPRSTIGDRLSLLELGPWLALLEKGELPMSHAVRVLVPLRGVPEKYHRQAIEKVRKDYRYGKKGGAGMSIGDFERLVESYYRSFMYPLSKSSKSFGKNPEFNTAAHDKECGCGTMSFELDYGAKRKCCGNPDWWRPKHRKAIAAKPKKKGSSGRASGPSGPKYQMPEGSTKQKVSWDMPKQLTQLTDEQGRWNVRRLGFDPSAVVIDDTKLVLCERNYGGAFVATKDAAAVKAARTAWDAVWQKREAELAAFLRADLEKLQDLYEVRGAGAHALIRAFAQRDGVTIVDVAKALGIPLPASLAKPVKESFNRDERLAKAIIDWSIRDITREHAEQIATALAYCLGGGSKPIDRQLYDEREKAFQAIEARKVPWMATGKKNGVKKAAKKVRGARVEAERDDDVDEELDDDTRELWDEPEDAEEFETADA